MSSLISFGERIKQARELRGMSAADLAAALNISEITVNYWETSEQELPDEITRKIVGALDISVSYLLGDSDNPEHKPIPPMEKTTVQQHPERRRERLWLRDLTSSENIPRPVFSCLGKCRELYYTLNSEKEFASHDELKSLARDLEKIRARVEELIQDKA